MTRAADTIPDAVGELRLDAGGQALFLQLASRLRAQAVTLEDLAHRGEVREVERTLAEIGTTCDRCHTAFRGLPAARW